MKTVNLIDGYFNSVQPFNIVPVQVDGRLVQLQHAVTPWMHKWTHIETLKAALREQYDSQSTLTGAI